MRYLSTRGQGEPLDFEQAMLDGLARDGGLLVPESWPRVSADDIRSLRGRPYADVALFVMRPFVGRCIDEATLKRILDEVYAGFSHHRVAPLVQTGDDDWVMELFHGPTLAFKDIAMQVLGRLYDHVLARSGTKATLIGATSGDTGSAAIEAIRGLDHASIFIMHPHGRTSEVQRRQMTTVDAPNVHNIAIEGTFDDCQNLLKAMFNDAAFRDRVKMSGVNSINWARVLPQVVYYFAAAVALGAPERPVSFSVPTGNFGDIYAGYVAKRMGLPIDRLIIASNVNDILTRVMHTGEHTLGDVERTLSPSMDIQISSNFERLMFDMYDRDGGAIAALMHQLKQAGRFTIEPSRLGFARGQFDAYRVDEQDTLDVIRCVYQLCGGYLVDPHTAVGVGAGGQARAAGLTGPLVVLGTAHPAKFPDAVEQATGFRPELPRRLTDLYEREERYTVLPADLDTVMGHIAALA